MATTSIVTRQVQDKIVSYAKIQDLTTGVLLGRYTAGTGVAQELTLGTGLSLNTSTGVITSTGSGGTVTAISIASANGFAGSSSGGATPSLTISTSITGVLKGNGTAISAAIQSDITTLIGATTYAVYNANGYLPLNGGTLTGNLILNADPTLALGAATKNYVDNLITGVVWTSADAATTANITLSGEQTIDGVLTASSKVLVKNQTTGSQNGIYISNSGAWTRATWATTGAQIILLAVIVEPGGTLNANTQWINTNFSVTVGTTSITFVQSAGNGTYTNGTGITLTGNVFSLNQATTDALYTPLGRNITVNGSTLSLTADRTFTITTTGTTNRITVTTGATLTPTIDISATYVGQASITTLGTIATGIWQGTAVADAYIASSGSWNTAFTNRITSLTVTGASGSATLISNVLNVPTYTIAGLGGIASSRYIVRETMTGLMNGANTTFTMVNSPVSGKEQLYLNGILQNPGSGNDYTISSATVTMLTAPASTDLLLISYIY